MAKSILKDPEEIKHRVQQKVEIERAEYANQEQIEQNAPALKSKEIFQALNANEDGDASLFIKLQRGRFCYDHAADRWFIWREQHWEEDQIDQALAAAQGVIDAYAVEAQRQSWAKLGATKAGNTTEANSHKTKEEALLKRIRTLQTRHRKENVLALAKVGVNSLGIGGNEWDRNPRLLGCKTGVIDLKTGKLRPGKPGDYIQKIAPTEWKGIDAPCPTWERFLNEIFNEDNELIAYIQRLFGYGIAGVAAEHILPIMYGKGRNGKSTFLEILKHTLGDLSYKTESELLLDQKYQKQSGAPNSSILELRGKRIVWATETSEGRKLHASKLKELTGGDTLNARAPYGKRHVEFQPTHLLILLTNHKPHAPSGDYALWERLHLIPFSVSFVSNPTDESERRVDRNLINKLKREASGILAWLVRGCIEWQRHGLHPPEVVRHATKEYRREEDIIGHFLNECCITNNNTQVKAGDLYKEYQHWTHEMGYRALSGKRFWVEIDKRFDSHTTNFKYYVGIGLKGRESD